MALMLLAVCMLATAVGIASVQRSNHRAEVDAALSTAAGQQATVLNDAFDRAASVVLVTARDPAFRAFLDEPGSTAVKVRRGGGEIPEVTAALGYLRELYPESFKQASFIDANGNGVARLVLDQVALPGELARDETGGVFFDETVQMGPGHVFHSRPYLSLDTHGWVISSSAMIPDSLRGGMVHLELSLDSFRLAAAEAVGSEIAVQVIDADTGLLVLDSRRSHLAMESIDPVAAIDGGEWVDRAGSHGALDTTAGQAAYVRMPPTDGNANDWLVVAIDTAPHGLLTGLGLGSMALAVASILLFVIGLFGFRSAQRELTDAANNDALTGLGNRRKLTADLEHACADHSHSFSLAMFDLDGFKHYNDTFGHPAGDALLERLARNLEIVAGQRGRAYRLGGDEFCLLYQAKGPAGDELIAEAMVALSEQGNGFSITASHGVVGQAEAGTADEMLRLTDKRMYAEKHGRRLTTDTQSRDVLLAALEERYPELLQHREELAELAERIATAMGLDEPEITLVRRSAELHDIGKVAIPDSILRKPEPLTEAEWEFMRRHSQIGERILDAAPALAPVARVIRAHHERWDGTGYPDRLGLEEIPLGARIVSVVDAYHAMILEDRPYKPRLQPDEAVDELLRGAGTQFDPAVVDVTTALLVRPSTPAAPTR